MLKPFSSSVPYHGFLRSKIRNEIQSGNLFAYTDSVAPISRTPVSRGKKRKKLLRGIQSAANGKVSKSQPCGRHCSNRWHCCHEQRLPELHYRYFFPPEVNPLRNSTTSPSVPCLRMASGKRSITLAASSSVRFSMSSGVQDSLVARSAFSDSPLR